MRSSVPNFQEDLRVLVVDDSVAMHNVVAASLAKIANLQRDEVTSAATAMRLLAEKRYALIITDINMPQINGLELLAFIRKSPATRDVPVLVLSSNATVGDQDRATKLGANAYLVKPFKPEALEATVRQMLGDSR